MSRAREYETLWGLPRVAERMTTLAPNLYQDLVGTPFVERGRDRARGIDCYGVVLTIYQRMGITLLDPYRDAPSSYGKAGQPEDTAEVLARLFGTWERTPPVAGAVAAFSQYGKRPDHAGVMITDRLFIHAVKYRLAPTGQVVISDLMQAPFCEWFLGAYAHRGN